MAEDIARPLCECHGEPMLKNGIRRASHGKPCKPCQNWCCATTKREAARVRFASLTGVAYNWRLLQMRRSCAMEARRKRERVG